MSVAIAAPGCSVNRATNAGPPMGIVWVGAARRQRPRQYRRAAAAGDSANPGVGDDTERGSLAAAGAREPGRADGGPRVVRENVGRTMCRKRWRNDELKRIARTRCDFVSLWHFACFSWERRSAK